MDNAIQVIKQLSKNVSIASTSAIVSPDITSEELENAFEFFGMVDKANHFWIGDTANAESHHYQHGHADKVAEKTGLAKNTIRNDKYVSDRVKSDVRTSDLSFLHHQQVAPLEERLQIEWLAKASDNKWSVGKLKQEIYDKKISDLIADVDNIPEDERYSIFQADINTVELDKQFDFIITDPPYPKEYLPLYEVLAKRASEWLKPKGLVLAMCGQSYLDEILSMMDKHLDYYWTACYHLPGQPTSLRQRQVNCSWKPILIYGNRNYKGKIFSDFFVSEKPDKEHHEWGQSVSGMLSMISQVCLPGQTILDPFLGAGTTGVASLMNHCLFTGFDIDKNEVNKSLVRMSEL